MSLYSIKMRASKKELEKDIHISGAERIIEKNSIKNCLAVLVDRALNHENGDPNFINLKIEKIEEEILRLKALPISQIDAKTPKEGFLEIKKQIEKLGILEASKILEKMKETSPMRGAMLLDIHTLKRLEKNLERGIRATYMDSEKSGLVAKKNHFEEAIVLATKVANAPHIVGEICVSDDINYSTGYFASKKTGYVRITNLKEKGDSFGGRIFLYDGKNESDLEETINFIEHKPVIVYDMPQLKKEENFFESELERLKKSDLYRTQDKIEGIRKEFIKINGKDYINFSSNSYLGLNQNRDAKQAGINALKKYGVGTGGSRLVCGNYDLHRALEETISRFKGCEDAILFNSGYSANLGVISSLLNEGDVIFSDELNHASIIDGCRLSKAKTIVYRHNDMHDLEEKIKNTSFNRSMVVSDAVFSMDGDILNLEEFLKISKKYNVILYVDEAHSTGVLGKTGKGICEYFNSSYPDILMGTLSKAIGGEGGYVAGKKEIIDYLRNKARSYIFSTSLSPSVIASEIKSFEILKSNSNIVKKLHENIEYFNNCLKDVGIKCVSMTPIFSIIIGDEKKTLEIAEKLFQEGYFIKAIRYPTVKKGAARLRITLNSFHTKKELKKLSKKLKEMI